MNRLMNSVYCKQAEFKHPENSVYTIPKTWFQRKNTDHTRVHDNP